LFQNQFSKSVLVLYLKLQLLFPIVENQIGGKLSKSRFKKI
jgi:hypothetical protein